MKKLIIIILSLLSISCKKECKIYSYSIDGGKEFTFSSDEKEKKEVLSKYTLDEKNRVSTKKYSVAGDIYEVYYNYDSKNRLKEVIEERYVPVNKGDYRIFVTETSTFTYNNLNPVKIKIHSKVNDHTIGYGEDYESECLIEYLQTNDKISIENFTTLNKLLQSMLPVKGGFILQDYYGVLPTKLIKSIIRKTGNEPSVKTTYNFIKDKENRINEIRKFVVFPNNENVTSTYRFNYVCD